MKTHNIDESGQKDDDDGEDAHQGAVQSGLDYPLRKSLQWDWEELGATATKRKGVMGKEGKISSERGLQSTSICFYSI